MTDKIVLSSDELNELLGKAESKRIMKLVMRVKLSRKNIKKIEDELNKNGMCVIRQRKKTPTKIEIVNNKFVTFTRVYSMQVPEIKAKAVKTLQEKREKVGV